MRHAIFRTAITFAIVLALPFGAALAQPKQAPQKGPPPPAPVKPYTPIAIKLPALFNDPSFEAFRKQLGEIAGKKDRAALSKLVVAQGFFWDGEKGNQADPKKSGIDNLSQVIGLAGKQPGRKAYILIALPIGVFVLLTIINRPYMEVMFTTGSGHLMLAGSLVMQFIGYLLMRKIADVKV